LDNFWNRPSYKKPYYYIHNINPSTVNPTNPYTNSGSGTDFNSKMTHDPDFRNDGNGNKIIEG